MSGLASMDSDAQAPELIAQGCESPLLDLKWTDGALWPRHRLDHYYCAAWSGTPFRRS